MDSVEDKCRSRMAQMFNLTAQWIPNINTGVGYISGRPDAEVRYGRNSHVDIECKGDSGSLFLGEPDNPDSTKGWHFHQRQWWERMDKWIEAPYFIAVLVAADRQASRIDYAKSGMFLVPPEAWLELEAKVFPRKTVALSPELERIQAHKLVTIESEWPQYRLTYSGGQYHIPTIHPIVRIMSCQ